MPNGKTLGQNSKFDECCRVALGKYLNFCRVSGSWHSAKFEPLPSASAKIISSRPCMVTLPSAMAFALGKVTNCFLFLVFSGFRYRYNKYIAHYMQLFRHITCRYYNKYIIHKYLKDHKSDTNNTSPIQITQVRYR